MKSISLRQLRLQFMSRVERFCRAWLIGLIVISSVGFACATNLTGLPTGARPTWIDGSTASQYPAEAYLIGVGVSTVKPGQTTEQIMAALDSAARVDMVKRLEVSISSSFSSLEKEEQRNGVVSQQTEIVSLVQETMATVSLDGVEIKGRWLDNGSQTAYALAVWPRAVGIANLQRKIASFIEQASSNEQQGDSLQGQDGPAAVRHYGLAYGAVQQARRLALFLRAMGTTEPVPAEASLRHKLASHVAKISLQPVAGQAQRVKANQSANQALQVQVRYGDAPAAGLPVRCSYQVGQIEGGGLSDPQGMAQCRIVNTGAMTGPAQAAVQLDIGALLGNGEESHSNQQLAPAPASFALVPKSLQSMRVLVKIFERIAPEVFLSSNQIERRFQSKLVEQGFGVQDGEAWFAAMPKEVLLQLDPKLFQEKAREIADLMVVGEAVSSYSSTLSGEVVVHRAALTLRALNVATGEIIATWTLEEKGSPGKGADKAAKKALEALVKKIDGSMLDGLKNKITADF